MIIIIIIDGNSASARDTNINTNNSNILTP